MGICLFLYGKAWYYMFKAYNINPTSRNLRRTDEMKKQELKKIVVWFVICLLVFIFSTFLHECGHGLANQINGVSVSTGFNRVGNAFRYPFDSDFRTGYDATQTFLMDFGIPITLVCDVLFSTVLYVKKDCTSYSRLCFV